MKIRKVLCVCFGNSDRSPAMEAVLRMFLDGTPYGGVVIESAGVSQEAESGGVASTYAIRACLLIGINITGHKKRWTKSLDLASYDLIICADDYVTALLLEQGADKNRIYNASISNGQWPFKFDEDYMATFQQILGAMFKVTSRYFGDITAPY